MSSTGIDANLVVGVVNIATGAMAALVIAMRIEVGISFSIVLRPRIDIVVGIINLAADPVTAVITAAASMFSMVVMMIVLGHTFEHCAQDSPGDGRA